MDDQVTQVTLVKYSNPVLVISQRDKKKMVDKNKEKEDQEKAARKLEQLKRNPSPVLLEWLMKDWTNLTQTEQAAHIMRMGPLGPEGGACQYDIDNTFTKQETADVLNSIIPPREWELNGQIWRQTVSTVPATRSDIIQLQELLDRRLRERNARDTGICHVRRELYTQFFDEIIRQVTINSAERGLLLLGVRNEIRTTIQAYESLYVSCSTYGIRKSIMGQQSLDQMDKEISQLQPEIENIKKNINDLKLQIKIAKQRNYHKREHLQKVRTIELQREKERNDEVKQQILAAVVARH